MARHGSFDTDLQPLEWFGGAQDDEWFDEDLVEAVTVDVSDRYAQAVLASSPTAYWRLSDEGPTAWDAVAANDGTYHGGVTQLEPTAPIGGDFSATFAAGDITVPDTAALRPGLGPFSLEFWVKRLGNPGATEFLIEKGDGPTAGWDVHITTAGLIRVRAGASVQYSTTVAVTDGNWHHVVVSVPKTSGTVTTYIDGVARGTDTAGTEDLSDSANPVYFAARRVGNNLTGSLDEVALYIGVALSAATVEAHYRAGVAIKQLAALGAG